MEILNPLPVKFRDKTFHRCFPLLDKSVFQTKFDRVINHLVIFSLGDFAVQLGESAKVFGDWRILV